MQRPIAAQAVPVPLQLRPSPRRRGRL